MKKDLTTKRILIYLGITFLLTYLYEFLIVYPMNADSHASMSGKVTMLISFVMLMPSLGMVLTRLVTKEGFRNAWIKPNFKGHIRYYVFSWLAPAVLTLAGIYIYFLVFPENFDGNMTLFQKALQATGQEISADTLKTVMVLQIISAAVLGPLMNFIFCLGEEWGWRGYLLPKMMEKFPIGVVLLINGIIWGLWHAPLTAIGHNYGTGYAGWPVKGIFAMCIFCVVAGVIFSYVTIRTGSCLPAVIAHGGLNGIASIGVYFSVDGGNPFIGPSPTGVVGGAAFIIVAVILAIVLIKEPKKAQIKGA